jgi:hypothetical protein
MLDTIATALATSLATAKLGLWTNTPTLSSSTLLADLTEPTFTGYAQVSLTTGARRSDAAGDQIIPMGTATFQPTATPTPAQTVKGVMLVAGTPSAVLWMAEYLDNPYTFAATTDALDIIYDVYVRAGTNWGGICTTCP